MRIIKSKCGKYDIMVDDDQYDRLIEFAPNGWEVKCKSKRISQRSGVMMHTSFYTYTRKTIHINGETIRRSFYIHRVIMDVYDPRVFVDHIECGNTFDNQRSNLRIVTPSQNARNRRASRTGRSKYLGVDVSYAYKTVRYRATIRDGGKVYLGIYDDEISAAYAYNLAATHIHGEYANLNDIDIQMVSNPGAIDEYITDVLKNYKVRIRED